jgi:hypothetical protein
LAVETERPRPSVKGGQLPLALAVLASIPGSLLGILELFHLGAPELAPPVQALLYGMAVIGAAFVLAWAAEAAQLDVSASLAIGPDRRAARVRRRVRVRLEGRQRRRAVRGELPAARP